jgi:hypothetical protein
LLQKPSRETCLSKVPVSWSSTAAV